MRHSNLAICCLSVQCLRGQQTHFSCKKGCSSPVGSHIHCPYPAEKAPGTAAVLLPSSSSLFPPGHPSALQLAFHAISYKSLRGQGWRWISRACHGVGWQNSPKGIGTMVLSDNIYQQHWQKTEFCRTKPNLFCSPAKMDLLRTSYPALISHLSSN